MSAATSIPTPAQPSGFSMLLRQLWIGLASVAFVIGGSAAEFGSNSLAGDAARPRLLDGAVFWVGNPLGKRKETATDARITSLVFSLDARRLLIGKENGLVATVDARNGRLLDSFKAYHSEVIAVLCRPGASAYFTVSRDDGIHEWAVARRQPIDFSVEQSVRFSSATISPDGKQLALASQYGHDGDSLSIYDTDSGKRTHVIGTGKSADSVCFSRDGNSLLCIVREEARIKMWDLTNGKLLWSRGDERVSPGFGAGRDFLNVCAFGPGEQDYTMAIDGSCFAESVFCICDLATGTIRKEFSARSGSASFALSPDGRWLATDSYPPAVEIWDAKTGKSVRKVAGHQETIRCLTFSPDGRFIASGADDGSVIVWDLGTAMNDHGGRR
jgi:WD40 repeat protein